MADWTPMTQIEQAECLVDSFWKSGRRPMFRAFIAWWPEKHLHLPNAHRRLFLTGDLHLVDLCSFQRRCGDSK